MTIRPHDVVDLYLAPVALGVDAELARLSEMSQRDLELEIALDTNQEPRTSEARRRALLETVTHRVELHGWTAAWHDRGLRLAHEDHHLVLGVPPNLQSYLAG